MGRVVDGLAHMWNAFTSDEKKSNGSRKYGYSSSASSRPHLARVSVSNERSIINTIYTRMAIDVSSVELKHVRVDEDGQYLEDMASGLQECLTVEPNVDQGPRSFMADFAKTLFHEGVAAIVPIETTDDPEVLGSYDIRQLRVGTITEWMPRQVRVSVYDDRPEYGYRREIVIDKRAVGIVENPFYDVMNEPNSTLQRLIHKLRLLDSIDENAASNKLDLIIQLPYSVKTEAKRDQANQRRRDIELQLKGSQYGIAYTDGTEKITQLNRSVENNLMSQIPYLWERLYDQLGITPEVLNGSADNATMVNYVSRTIEPILDALVEEITRKFLTKTARTQGQTILYFRDPFKLIPLSALAEVADVLSRNEIITPNELRKGIGMRPSSDPAANMLRNSNMPDPQLPVVDELEEESEDDPDGSEAVSDLGGTVNDILHEFGSEGVDLDGLIPGDETLSALDKLDSAITQAMSDLSFGEEDDDAG